MPRPRLLLVGLAAALALAVPASASADFGFLGDFGSGGTGNGQFTEPGSVAAAPDGSLWVADGLRVQKFAADGTYVTQVQVGRFGVGPVAVDGGGNLYVANLDDSRIDKFDANGAPLGSIGSAGEGPGQLRGICGMDLDAAGDVWVADGRGGYCDSARIQEFGPGGNLLKEVKLSGKNDPATVGDMAIDAAGNIFVANSGSFGRSQVYKLSPDAVVVSKFGSRGSGPAQFGDLGPESLAIASDGTLYAVDRANHRVQHLGPDGAFLGQFGAAPAFAGVAVAPNGDVLVTRGKQSVPTPEDFDALGVNRVMRFGQGAPAAPPSPLALAPGAKITLGATLAKKCGLEDPETGRTFTNCLGMREATIEWSAGCPAAGPLTRRSVEVSLGGYAPASPKTIAPVVNSAADSGSVKVVLYAGSKVTPKITVSCVAYSQPDGEPVTARGSAKGNTVTTAPVAYTGYMEYSRSPEGTLLGNFRGKKVRGAIQHGKEVRLFWAAAHDESLRKGYASVKVHIQGAGINVVDYFHSYHREDYGPRLLIKPRKPGQLKVWVTVNGVRSSNTIKLRVA